MEFSKATSALSRRSG